jgi:hypothetical protein
MLILLVWVTNWLERSSSAILQPNRLLGGVKLEQYAIDLIAFQRLTEPHAHSSHLLPAPARALKA